MGASASINRTPVVTETPQERFYCHSCRKMFYDDIRNLSVPRDIQDACVYCRSTFVENMDRNTQRAIFHQESTEVQARSLANAALMLRMLEFQLHDELHALHSWYFEQGHIIEGSSKSKLTETMKDKLRDTEVSPEMLCSLPHCPICSDDYTECCKVVQLPCSHFFHEGCINSWFNTQLTCPICRFEMTDELPSIEELLRFSSVELKERLTDMPGVDEVDFTASSKKELASLLRDYISDRKLNRTLKSEVLRPSVHIFDENPFVQFA